MRELKEKQYQYMMTGLAVLTMILVLGIYMVEQCEDEKLMAVTSEDYIKWVDYQVSTEAMKKACRLDVESYYDEVHLNWIVLLAYAATQSGGKFDKTTLEYIDEIAHRMTEREITVEELKSKYKYFAYYYEAYEAVLGGFLGEYEIEMSDESGKNYMQKQYGLKVFSPIAKGFPYQDYDDFGVSRSYGYERKHLGHDMMGQVGTPIICCESGYVEAIGWNKYGGWRIGIRSFDQKRYYYYAHLRQNSPYAEGLEIGDVVTAGDVIGYMGHTGYSETENVNNIETVHLHIGLQLIFDESQKEGNNEIWIDFYQLARFLQVNQSEVVREDETKEWHRKFKMLDCSVEEFEKEGKIH